MNILNVIEEYFLNNQEIIKKSLLASKFDTTSKVLYNFYEKSRSISEIICSLDFNNHSYPGVILLRSQIEHFIISSYIWIQFRIKEQDDIAKTYYGEYLVQEILKRLNYAKQNKTSISSRYAKLFQKLLDELTRRKIITQKDIEKINIEANQFDIRKVSDFFDKELPLEFDNIIKPERIKQFLENYNYFSSFVHGGPSADLIMNEKENNPFKKAIAESKEWSSNIINFQRLQILYFLAMNDKTIERDLKKLIDDMFK